MWQLLLVSIIWAFSFGLIKGQLTGISPEVVASIRLILSACCFMPVLIWAKTRSINYKLMALGAVQFGIMYLLYIRSYQYLPGYMVAVFTIFTPLYVILLNSIYSRKLSLNSFLPITISIMGAGIIVFKQGDFTELLLGFLLLQLANIAFAFGQVTYRLVDKKSKDRENLFWMYCGAALLAGIYTLFSVDISSVLITTKQWMALCYLGVIASGLGFYLFNKGARKVNSSTLAVMNNAYVPFAVIFAIVLFGEKADMTRLIIGGSLIAVSVILAQKQSGQLK